MSDEIRVKNLPTLKKDADDFESIVAAIGSQVESLKRCNARMGENWDDIQYQEYRSECEKFFPLVGKFLDSSNAIHSLLEEHIKSLKATQTFV